MMCSDAGGNGHVRMWWESIGRWEVGKRLKRLKSGVDYKCNGAGVVPHSIGCQVGSPFMQAADLAISGEMVCPIMSTLEHGIHGGH